MPVAAGDKGQRRWKAAHAEFGERLRRSLHVCEDEAEPDPRNVDERLLQCIWFDQFIDPARLATSSGKSVEILKPGRWNTGRGPDFLDAEIKLAGEIQRGDVELHLQSAGWTQHAHHQDFEYNTVVLHVCLEASDDRPYEEKQNGERLERLVLADALEPDLDTLARTISVADYPFGRPAHVGKCHEQFLQLSDPQLTSFIRTAGRARMEDKIARFDKQLASASMPQLIYQSIMTGQGYKANKTLYFLLSKRAPVAELFDFAEDVAPEERAELFLSVLLHVAQIFPTQADFFEESDAETTEFARRLERHWKLVRPYFADRLMPPTKRWHAGMRPPGFPGRRLAAVALLLQRLADRDAPLFEHYCQTFRALDPEKVPAKEWKRIFKDAVAELEVSVPTHYFTTHYSLGGKPCRPQALLGEPAARSLFYNVFFPLMILRARREKDAALERNCWHAAELFPALPKNSITGFMKKRLFSDSGRDKSLFRTELNHQALLKVFYDCCSGNERTCDSCSFLNPPFTP